METWKKIDGYDKYYVSSHGKVKTTDFNHTGKEKEVKVFRNIYGYMAVNLMQGGKRKRHLVHRLVAKAFYPLSETVYDQVNHIDGNKQNNFYLNLEWCDARHNIMHALRIGLTVPKRGEEHPNAKLSDEEIIDIKRLRNKGGMKLNSIAKLYSISFQHVSSICLYGGV